MNDPKKTLGYSSLPNTPNAELDAERDRLEQVENYNLTTYGDRRPILDDLLRMVAVLVAIGIFGVLSLLLLPSWMAELVTSVAVLAFVIWRNLRQIR